ncbi:MAG: hypothetical protein HY554_18060 [Elusimicrobia bacterium]|nr:hypothetical protein [Elusimicrobiota bacterium]
MTPIRLCLLVLCLPGLASWAIPISVRPAAAAAGHEQLERLQAKFAPVDLKPDVSGLPASERQALEKLVRAAWVMDALYLRQAWAGNESMLLKLLADDSPLGRARLRYFLTQKGPWDRQEENRPFIPGAPAKAPQASFYPADATKEEVGRWIEGLTGKEKEAATGFFTAIRRGAGGAFMAVPYSVEYQNELQQAAGLLREAAALTAQPTLRAYLEKRADAFLSNDYYDSDVAWMELDASLEPTIGPYETYEDEWFGYKAAFEAFIALRDEGETAKLQKFGTQLQWLEDNLPIEPAFRNPKLGALAPIRVVNQVFASGDAAHGVTTAAFNLPNDERVTREKGSKRTMLKNVQEAKFRVVLLPLAKLALAPQDQERVDFDAFFTHILMHELMHGLGPHEVRGGGGAVRKALKETAGALEEAKADISGLWALQKLIDQGVLDKSMEKTMYLTFLASSFRTLRFGIGESHGKGMALQLNYLLDRGAVAVAKDGTFSIDEAKVRPAVEALTRDIMEVQAKGDYAAARAMLERLAVIRPEAEAVIRRAEDIPVDISPRY